MKRSLSSSTKSSPAKKRQPSPPPYHLTPSVLEPSGEIQWPAPSSQISTVREIIKRCASSNATTLLVPDKDADGLSSGAILRHTLIALGLPEQKIKVHFVGKGRNVHDAVERELMEECEPRFVFVLDQGTRSAPPIVRTDGSEAVVIDHHHVADEKLDGDGFPDGCTHITASTSPPVATTSLLTYHLCAALHPSVAETHAWLCVVGTHGDLGTTIKWEPPFPDMTQVFKTHTKSALNNAVSSINAPRRTAKFDIVSAWDALTTTSDPKSIPNVPRLQAARREVSAEVERCTHTAPKFSPDGRIAVFRISSGAQIHPVIATRWAGHLQSKALEVVMVANEGYLPDKVNFSCRVPRCAREKNVNIIAKLREYASLAPEDGDETGGEQKKDERAPLLERLGENFARGHVQASGGIVAKQEFEELMQLMRIGEKLPSKKKDEESPSKKTKKGVIDSGQKNTLMGYFGKKESQMNSDTTG